ncbi:uncharacterized protein LOC131520737 isoform X2 [Onychostoma macrolepis]|uniref:uncharacterized protein LOC131520737 isoform X2 n=1 Tax=Onychostoma macrolepis TaxID=369639 RepID=UPI00272C70C9|nr:uncharacterized protein LOC131520737 isoform X2 [Onychostoma macrolepis]
MRKAAYIATTTDCWTARRRSFIGITAHWLDPCSFERHSVALAFKQLKGSHTFDLLACAMHDIHTEYGICAKIVRTTTDNGSNFIKAFHVFGPDENNNVTTEEVTEKVTTQEEGEDDDPGEMEVEFIDVAAILDEDDGLQYQLPKHHRCACHLLNLVSTVDVNNANRSESYKKLSRSSFSKCQALWNKTSRSTIAAEVVEEHCKLQLLQPNATRWNSFYLAVERIVRILKDQGEGAMRAVCAALKVPMYSPAEMAFLGEYTTTMNPVAKATNILQGDSNIQMGWLLPTITTLITKLEKTRASLRFCKPLVDALLDGLTKRFGNMMSDPELVAAAIIHPKFKTSWTSDEDILRLGLHYIKENLPHHDESLQPVDNSSSTSDEEDFFSNIKHARTQETSKQLDAYLSGTAEGEHQPLIDMRKTSLKSVQRLQQRKH